MSLKPLIRLNILWFIAAALLSTPISAQAAVTCNASSSGFSSGYTPTDITIKITSATLTVSCTNSLTGPSPQTLNYSVTVNNGLQPNGTQNRAASGANFINYAVATDSGCISEWKGATAISDTISISTGQTIVNTYPYYSCIPALQNPPAGNYIDTLTMNGTATKIGGGPNPVFVNPGTFPGTIITPAVCNIASPPVNINFTYTSFSPTIVNANTTFSVDCTATLPYTMSLDITGGTIAGLNYTLGLSTTVNSGGTNPLTSTGTGVTQSFYVNGSIAAGQSGTCAVGSCSGFQIHMLTITY